MALSPAGVLGLHTCFNPSTSACVPPARFTRVATSSVTSNVTQLDFARLSTRVLATCRRSSPRMSSSVYPFACAASGAANVIVKRTPAAITAREQTFRLCMGNGWEDAIRYVTKVDDRGYGSVMLPLLVVRVFQDAGNARLPFVCHLEQSFSTADFPHFSLSRRCHFQDVQYHYFRFRVTLGKVNVYKVEARLNRDLVVSRPWHIFVLLTVVDTSLLCAINHSHAASRNHNRTRALSNALHPLRQPVQYSRRSQSLRGLRRPQDHYLGLHGRFPTPPRSPSR